MRLFSYGKRLERIVIRHPHVQHWLDISGLGPLLVCSYKLLDKGLVSAFVERWQRDTNSFHLPVGEMTITLDDVSSLLHLPITGASFTVTVFDRDQAAALVHQCLGCSTVEAFNEIRSGSVRLTWLLELYETRCLQGRYIQASRALLLYIVGCTLFADKSETFVSVIYLECFRNLQTCGDYAWGVTALAYLYDQLRDASMFHGRGITGYLTLLQVCLFLVF